MRYYVLITHGNLATGLKSSIEMLSGYHDNIRYVNAYIDEETNIEDELTKTLSILKESDELIILTDILGGSTTNTANTIAQQHSNIHVVAGVNLSFILELLLDDKTATELLIRETLIQSREAMVYCNDMLTISDEEF